MYINFDKDRMELEEWRKILDPEELSLFTKSQK